MLHFLINIQIAQINWEKLPINFKNTINWLFFYEILLNYRLTDFKSLEDSSYPICNPLNCTNVSTNQKKIVRYDRGHKKPYFSNFFSRNPWRSGSDRIKPDPWSDGRGFVQNARSKKFLKKFFWFLKNYHNFLKFTII